MFAVANFVGMEFNTFSFVGSFLSLFIYLFPMRNGWLETRRGQQAMLILDGLFS